MTRVLPEPGPAMISSGPSVRSTASRWRGVRGARIADAAGGGAAPPGDQGSGGAWRATRNRSWRRLGLCAGVGLRAVQSQVPEWEQTRAHELAYDGQPYLRRYHPVRRNESEAHGGQHRDAGVNRYEPGRREAAQATPPHPQRQVGGQRHGEQQSDEGGSHPLLWYSTMEGDEYVLEARPDAHALHPTLRPPHSAQHDKGGTAQNPTDGIHTPSGGSYGPSAIRFIPLMARAPAASSLRERPPPVRGQKQRGEPAGAA